MIESATVPRMSQNVQWKTPERTFQHLVGQISRTFKELEQSVRSSHTLERRQFQNELQLHIDKHQLSLSLDQQKYHNKRLTKLAMSLSDSSSGARVVGSGSEEDFRNLRETCQELKGLLQKRESQLKKTRSTLKQVTDDNIKLARAYETRSNSYKELAEKYESLKRQFTEKNGKHSQAMETKRRPDQDRGRSEQTCQCEHQSTLQEIQMFYESQIAELTQRLEEQSLYSFALEEQQIHLAQEQSLAEFEKIQHSNSRRNR